MSQVERNEYDKNEHTQEKSWLIPNGRLKHKWSRVLRCQSGYKGFKQSDHRKKSMHTGYILASMGKQGIADDFTHIHPWARNVFLVH